MFAGFAVCTGAASAQTIPQYQSNINYGKGEVVQRSGNYFVANWRNANTPPETNFNSREDAAAARLNSSGLKWAWSKLGTDPAIAQSAYAAWSAKYQASLKNCPFSAADCSTDFADIAAPTQMPATGMTTAFRARQDKRAFVAYYPSWLDNWFNAKTSGGVLTLDQTFQKADLARIPSMVSHVVIAFAFPDFKWWGLNANTFDSTGMTVGSGFSITPFDLKRVIDVLHARNIKVLVAVGGASYSNRFAWLVNNSGSPRNTVITDLARFMVDLDIDGLDLDYESGDLNEYAVAFDTLSKAVNTATTLGGRKRILSMAGWSTGADCTAATADSYCSDNRISWFGGKAGLERQLFQAHPEFASALDMMNVMSYDAGVQHFDPIVSWRQYRDLLPSSVIVNVGMQIPAEGAGTGAPEVKATLLVGTPAELINNTSCFNASASISNSQYTADNYGMNNMVVQNAFVPAQYTVDSMVGAVVSSTAANRNPRDGGMLWHIKKVSDAPTVCGTANRATASSVLSRAARILNLLPPESETNVLMWK